MNSYWVFFGTYRLEDWYSLSLFAMTGGLIALAIYMEYDSMSGGTDVNTLPPKQA